MKITGWLTGLCAGAIIIMITEWLIPEGGLRKTAKFALGIMFLTLIIKPMMELLNSL